MNRRPPGSTLFPYPPLFRSQDGPLAGGLAPVARALEHLADLGTADLDRAQLLERGVGGRRDEPRDRRLARARRPVQEHRRSEEHTSELQSRQYLVCRLLLEK